ncbi:MAG: MarR family transcriptional regulator [Jiangellales bacterium]
MTGADEVDRIAAAWAREQPDVDLSPLHVLSRVTRLARHLDRARRAAFSAHGLEAGEFDVLAALRRSGPPYEQSPGRLGTWTMVTSGTMTARLDKLEGRGLVRRRTDPNDRRAVIVALTPTGSDVVGAALASLLEQEHALLAAVSGDDQRRLADLLREILVPLDGTPDAARS